MSVPIDWALFVKLAQQQGVLHWLDNTESLANVLPGDVLAAARNEHVITAQRNLFLAAELIRLIECFRQAATDVLAFKGVIAAMQFHGDLASRPSGDLDLLVHTQDYDRAAELLEQAGYVPQTVYYDSLQGLFWHPTQDIAVDLHWSIPPTRPPFSHRVLWRHRTEIDLLGARVPTFDTYSAIAIASINTVKGYWNVPLRQLVDVLVSMRSLSNDDWHALITRGRQIGCVQFILAAACTCALLFPGALPSAITAAIERNPNARRISNEVILHLFERTQSATAPRAFATRSDYESALDDRTFGKILDRLHRMVTPNAADTAFLPLPDRYYILYYLVRPIRLLLRGRHRGPH